MIVQEEMWEFKIFSNSQFKPDKFYSLIKEIYDKILIDDEWWHFFYEGEYMVIRCQHSFMPKVRDLLQDKGKDIYHVKEWIDNIKTTKEFQEEFQYIFHGYSVIAMKTQRVRYKKLFFLADRVIHCFLNNMTTKSRSKDVWWEPRLTDNLARGRVSVIKSLLKK